MTTPLPPLAACENKASILLEAYTTGGAEAMARLYTAITDRAPALLARMPSLERVTFDTWAA